MIKNNLIFIAFILIAGCSKSTDRNDDIKVNDTNIRLSMSQKQLQVAQYDSENQKKALSGFITGTEFCEKYKSITSTENGFYVSVPVDYNEPSKGTTQIWAYFSSGPMNSKLPTVIYFDGGSGGNSHGSKKYLKNYNELRYDQRGIGCSHPESLELYRDPDFYSNENNAKDANEIRKHLGLQKVSLIGGSYGTVVATVFASLFSENTTAVILDGTVYDSDDDSSTIGFYLKRMYKTLPEPTQLGMKKYFTKSGELTSLWSLARLAMYANKPMDMLKSYLIQAFPSENEVNTDTTNKLFNPNLSQEAFFGDTLESVEAFNNQVLNCKNNPQKSTIELSLFGRNFYEFVKYPYQIDRTEDCAAINVKDEFQKPFSANNYPITVPVTYFQGNMDSATPAGPAVKHYKFVPVNQKQLFIAKGGGHCPALTELYSHVDEFIDVIESALDGKKITPDQLTKVKSASSEKANIDWVYTAKNW
jgi:proline iminopeptidase